MTNDKLIWIRGAGELGSAAALVLHRSGFNLILSELAMPLAIRRPVTFSDAIFDGESRVEDIVALLDNRTIDQASGAEKSIHLTSNDELVRNLKPVIVVDARMLKNSHSDIILDAKLTIGLGPGFEAGKNCHLAIETKRGHSLGRIIRSGTTIPDSGIPGNIANRTKSRVIYSKHDGKIEWMVDFGDLVKQEQVIGLIDNKHEIVSPLDGMVRGLISPRIPSTEGLKIADVDPRGETVDYQKISDKALAVGRAVLEAILINSGV